MHYLRVSSNTVDQVLKSAFGAFSHLRLRRRPLVHGNVGTVLHCVLICMRRRRGALLYQSQGSSRSLQGSSRSSHSLQGSRRSVGNGNGSPSGSGHGSGRGGEAEQRHHKNKNRHRPGNNSSRTSKWVLRCLHRRVFPLPRGCRLCGSRRLWGVLCFVPWWLLAVLLEGRGCLFRPW
jgi:hypothetical protein